MRLVPPLIVNTPQVAFCPPRSRRHWGSWFVQSNRVLRGPDGLVVIVERDGLLGAFEVVQGPFWGFSREGWNTLHKHRRFRVLRGWNIFAMFHPRQRAFRR